MNAVQAAYEHVAWRRSSGASLGEMRAEATLALVMLGYVKIPAIDGWDDVVEAFEVAAEQCSGRVE